MPPKKIVPAVSPEEKTPEQIKDDIYRLIIECLKVGKRSSAQIGEYLRTESMYDVPPGTLWQLLFKLDRNRYIYGIGEDDGMIYFFIAPRGEGKQVVIKEAPLRPVMRRGPRPKREKPADDEAEAVAASDEGEFNSAPHIPHSALAETTPPQEEEPPRRSAAPLRGRGINKVPVNLDLEPTTNHQSPTTDPNSALVEAEPEEPIPEPKESIKARVAAVLAGGAPKIEKEGGGKKHTGAKIKQKPANPYGIKYIYPWRLIGVAFAVTFAAVFVANIFLGKGSYDTAGLPLVLHYAFYGICPALIAAGILTAALLRKKFFSYKRGTVLITAAACVVASCAILITLFFVTGINFTAHPADFYLSLIPALYGAVFLVSSLFFVKK